MIRKRSEKKNVYHLLLPHRLRNTTSHLSNWCLREFSKWILPQSLLSIFHFFTSYSYKFLYAFRWNLKVNISFSLSLFNYPSILLFKQGGHKLKHDFEFLLTVNASSYIVSVVLVLIVGALVGVFATVSHHLHHRRLLLHEPASASILHHHRHHHHRHHHHHHHREELPASHQRRLLLQDHHRHPGTPVSDYLFLFISKFASKFSFFLNTIVNI